MIPAEIAPRSHACRFTHNKPAPCKLRQTTRTAWPQACAHALGGNGGFLLVVPSQAATGRVFSGLLTHRDCVAHSLGHEPAGRVTLAPHQGTERQLNKAGPVCSPNPRFVEWYLSNYLRQDLRKEDFKLILTTELFGFFWWLAGDP